MRLKSLAKLGNYNKKAFKIAKGVKTAEAIMNTYAGANQALAAYPPPFSYIAAAGQIAFGMAQVAQIKSQSFAGRAAGGMVQAGQPYMVGEMGKEMFIPNTGGRIVNNRDTEAGLGATNINFSITTVDARGFDELLNSRRGQIVNMVNRAMNDRGRAGVTA
jgi:SLT domain-containing protein